MSELIRSIVQDGIRRRRNDHPDLAIPGPAIDGVAKRCAKELDREVVQPLIRERNVLAMTVGELIEERKELRGGLRRILDSRHDDLDTGSINWVAVLDCHLQEAQELLDKTAVGDPVD